MAANNCQSCILPLEHHESLAWCRSHISAPFSNSKYELLEVGYCGCTRCRAQFSHQVSLSPTPELLCGGVKTGSLAAHLLNIAGWDTDGEEGEQEGWGAT